MVLAVNFAPKGGDLSINLEATAMCKCLSVVQNTICSLNFCKLLPVVSQMLMLDEK